MKEYLKPYAEIINFDDEIHTTQPDASIIIIPCGDDDCEEYSN